MFDIPDAKRVRREDLDLSSSRASSVDAANDDIDPGLAAAYHDRLASLYGDAGAGEYVMGEEEDDIRGDQDGDREEQEEEEFAFRLFGGEDARRIVIREEDPGTGAFLGGRDPRVFILQKAHGEGRARFESVAVSGDEVLRGRERRAWGLEVPWRVVVLKDNRRKKGDDTSDKDKGAFEGKRKPGKKRRIVLRERKRKIEEARKRREEGEREREEREREKRTRRNREKKVKRKMKEKAKKAGGGEGGGEGVGGGEGEAKGDGEAVDVMDEGSD